MAANPKLQRLELSSAAFFWGKNGCGGDYDSQESENFPSVLESELSERNKNRGRCKFFSVFAKEGKAKAINL